MDNPIADIAANRPWLVAEYAEAMGLSGLAVSTILHAIATARIEWGDDMNEADVATYKMAERRDLARIYSGDQLTAAVKRAEAAIRVGQTTELGRALSASPFRWNCTVQSLLASKAKVSL